MLRNILRKRGALLILRKGARRMRRNQRRLGIKAIRTTR
jgi:hypothetical protein